MSSPSDPETPRERAERVLREHVQSRPGGLTPVCDSQTCVQVKYQHFERAPWPCLPVRLARDVIALSQDLADIVENDEGQRARANALEAENQRLRETVEKHARLEERARKSASLPSHFNTARDALRELGLWKEPGDASNK